MTEAQTHDRRYVDEKQAAAFLGCSAAALRRWRRLGQGPAVTRLSKLIRYKKSALEAYAAANTEDFIAKTTRGRPFQPGNKLGRGRPKGSRNRVPERKIIQIEVTGHAAIALADDGTVWSVDDCSPSNFAWERWPDLPQE